MSKTRSQVTFAKHAGLVIMAVLISFIQMGACKTYNLQSSMSSEQAGQQKKFNLRVSAADFNLTNGVIYL